MSDDKSEQDELFLAEEEPSPAKPLAGAEEKPWKVLIVDDEPALHSVTHLVFKGFRFEGRPLQFLDAYSGAEAKRLLKEHPDAAMALVDVVMESDHAGLELVRFIREEISNRFIRIVLRTGQPGQAPEPQVMANYDINDYKEKTDLPERKMITMLTSALRSYRDLMVIEQNRQGLERIVNATESLFESRSLRLFATGILTQLVAILGLRESAFYTQASALAANHERGRFILCAGTGEYESRVGEPLEEAVAPEIMEKIVAVCQSHRDLFLEDAFIGCYPTTNNSENLIYLGVRHPLTPVDRDLIRIFSTNLGFAFDNLFINQDLKQTKEDLTLLLSGVAERGDADARSHALRVAQSARLLGEKQGMTPAEADILKDACPMHDLGEIHVPPEILDKPGPLTEEERLRMQTHTRIGFEMMRGSGQKVLQAGTIIAEQHHERWDGKGYPQGLAGEKIHIFARITALIDAFDGLLHPRSYRRAWPLERVLDHLQAQRSGQFDPQLVDLLLADPEPFLEIQRRLGPEG